MPRSPSQQALFESTAAALQGKAGNDIARRDREGIFDREGWDACASIGLTGLAVPQDMGGGGLDIAHAIAALEAFGLACEDNGLALSLGAHVWGCLPMLLASGSAARRDIIADLAQGKKIAALAVTEEAAGSDLAGMATTAMRTAGGYRLNGRKIYITNAPIADTIIVLARTSDAGPAFGLSAFCIEKGTAGLSTSGPVDKMGLRTAMMGEVLLDDCTVPESARIGAEGAGLALFLKAMEHERAFILAPAIGAMQRLYDRSAAYARKRQQFGQAIAEYQAISHRLVEMHCRIETCRLILREAAQLKDAGKSITRHAAMAKMAISEGWVQSAQDAMAIHAGRGYLAQTGLERELRDAQGSLYFSGTGDIQRQTIARLLKLTAS